MISEIYGRVLQERGWFRAQLAFKYPTRRFLSPGRGKNKSRILQGLAGVKAKHFLICIISGKFFYDGPENNSHIQPQ